jgi:AbrB family looped-hinge helix DNA binding protein
VKPRQKTRIDPQGRIVIPAEVRQQLGMKPGDALSLRVIDGELRITTYAEAIRRVQEFMRSKVGNRTGLVDEFIAERRREAERE